MKNSPEAVACMKLFLSFIAGFSRNKMMGWEMKWEKGRGEWGGSGVVNKSEKSAEATHKAVA